MATDLEKLMAFRRQRMAAALEKHGGNKRAFGKALGYADGAHVRQMIEGERPISEKTVAKVESLHGFRDWFAVPPEEPAPLVSAAGPEMAVFVALAKLPDGPAKDRLLPKIYQLIAQAEEESRSEQRSAETPARPSRLRDLAAPLDTRPARP